MPASGILFKTTLLNQIFPLFALCVHLSLIVFEVLLSLTVLNSAFGDFLTCAYIRFGGSRTPFKGDRSTCLCLCLALCGSTIPPGFRRWWPECACKHSLFLLNSMLVYMSLFCSVFCMCSLSFSEFRVQPEAIVN